MPTQTNTPLPTQTNTPLPTQTNTPLPTQTSTQLPSQTNSSSADSQGWSSYSYTLEPGVTYAITVTAKEGYSFDSYAYVTSSHWASTTINDAQSTLSVSGDEMTINAHFTDTQTGKGSTASIALTSASSTHLDLEVSYGTATITVK